MRKILSILLFLFTLCILPILIIIELISPNRSQGIKNALLKFENKIKGENVLKEAQNIEPQLSEKPQFKKATVYIPPSVGEYQSWNQTPDFAKKDNEILDDIDLAGFRYVLDYKDRFGNVTTRGIDIIGVHKEYGNNRWYFFAETIEGERTFKSQRVMRLKDQWFNQEFTTAKAIREHILSEYEVIQDIED